MKKLLTILFCMGILAVSAQEISPLGNIRHSSRDADGNLHIRCDLVEPGLDLPQLEYSTGQAWQSVETQELAAGVLEALVPYEWGQNLRYRYRMESEYLGETVMFGHTGTLEGETFPAPITELVDTGTDPAGDSLMVYKPALDLEGSWMASSPQKLYRSLTNHTGSYPTFVNLTTYNLYLSTIINPSAVTDSVTYAMIYTFNVPGIISSGLYKMGMDAQMNPTFQRLGDIQTSTSGGTLQMACSWSDLLSDPGFAGFDPEADLLGFVDLTMQISVDLGSMEPSFAVGDMGATSLISFERFAYQVTQNTLPELSLLSWDLDTNLVELLYTDADGDFPLEAVLEIWDEPDSFYYVELEPIYNPDGSISIVALVGDDSNWSVNVSDNGIDYASYSHSVSADDPAAPQISGLRCSLPNPLARSIDRVTMQLSGLKQEPLKISLYNIRGQKVLDVAELYPNSEELSWEWNSGAALEGLGGGIYFFKVEQGGRQIRKKIIILR